MDNEFENQDLNQNSSQNLNQNPNQPAPFQQPPVYQPNYYNPNMAGNQVGEEPLSVGEWLLTFLLLVIPCVNLIMLFVWAFGDGNKSRRNFCRAYLILQLILVVLFIILCLIFGTSLLWAWRSMY